MKFENFWKAFLTSTIGSALMGLAIYGWYFEEPTTDRLTNNEAIILFTAGFALLWIRGAIETALRKLLIELPGRLLGKWFGGGTPPTTILLLIGLALTAGSAIGQNNKPINASEIRVVPKTDSVGIMGVAQIRYDGVTGKIRFWNGSGWLGYLPISGKFEAYSTIDAGTPDAAFRVNRTLSSGATSGHGFRDQTIFTRAAQAYNAFDAASDMGDNSATTHDHWAGFQARGRVNGATLTNWYGAWTQPTIANSATVSNVYGYYSENATGVGTITTQYGLYVASLTKGSTNWGVYVDGSTKNFFGGKILLNSTDRLLNTINPQFQIEGTGAATSSASLVRNSNTNSGPSLYLGKSRGTVTNSYTVVQNGDVLGSVSFQGADGTLMSEGARISGVVSAAPGSNDLPTDLVFYNSPDGSISSAETFRIKSTGVVNIPITPTNNDAQTQVLVRNSSSGDIQYRNASSLGGTVTSGTYTPTFSSGSNLDSTPSATASTSKYTRVGDMVTFMLYVNIDATIAGTYTFNFTLPVASSLTAATQVLGVGGDATLDGVEVVADHPNDRATVTGSTTSTTVHSIYITGMYEVL